MEPDLIDLAPDRSWAALFENWDVYGDPVTTAGVAGLVLGFLSAYIVLRRMVFLSAAVTQAAGLGVALSFFVAIEWGIAVSPTAGGVALSLAAALTLIADPSRLGVTREALLGIVFALASGAAVIVGGVISQEAHDIKDILFGIGVLIGPDDKSRVMWAAGSVMFVQLWWFRGLTFAAFDPIAARIQRLPVLALDTALLLSVGVMVGVSAKALGSMPVFALATMPGIAALAVSRGRLAVTFAVAAVFGAVSGAGGYASAYFFDFDVGASQAVLAVAIAVGALVVSNALKLALAVRRRRSGR